MEELKRTKNIEMVKESLRHESWYEGSLDDFLLQAISQCMDANAGTCRQTESCNKVYKMWNMGEDDSGACNTLESEKYGS